MQLNRKIIPFFLLSIISLLILHQSFPHIHHVHDKSDHGHVIKEKHNHHHGHQHSQHHDSENHGQQNTHFLGFLLTGHTHAPNIISEYYFPKTLKSATHKVKTQKSFYDLSFTFVTISKCKALDHQIIRPPPGRIINPFLSSHSLRGPPALA